MAHSIEHRLDYRLTIGRRPLSGGAAQKVAEISAVTPSYPLKERKPILQFMNWHSRLGAQLGHDLHTDSARESVVLPNRAIVLIGRRDDFEHADPSGHTCQVAEEIIA